MSVTRRLGVALGCMLLSAASYCGAEAGERRGELVVVPRVSCESLSGLELASIGGAGSEVRRAAVVDRDGHSFCQVEGRLAPEIRFQVLLPQQGWTGRYLQVGCGGLCGAISLRAAATHGCEPLEDGRFVVASTDMGHQGMGGEFGKDPQKRIDFAYRAVHLTAVAAKRAVQAFYGRRPDFSYFVGCSDGGREALIEALRYPDEFDGIVAGAPIANFQVQNSFYHAWLARSNTGADGKPIVNSAQLPLLHAAAVAQCDERDGLKDGLILDPRACSFDPGVIQCAPGQSDGCLSPAVVEAARKLYAGPVEVGTGRPIALGGPQPGSELSWQGVFVPVAGNNRIFSRMIAADALSGLVFESNPPAGDLVAGLQFDQATFDRLRKLQGLYGAMDINLRDYARAGGKLILWHGWSDPHVSPLNTIAYYDSVRTFMGERETSDFSRLYLFPGVYHCDGGDGPSQFDLLTPMMEWVEHGRPPHEILARKDSPAPVSRPVFPYPFVARYHGQGSPDDVTNYTAVPGQAGGWSAQALSAEFLQPDTLLDCNVKRSQLDCRDRKSRIDRP